MWHSKKIKRRKLKCKWTHNLIHLQSKSNIIEIKNNLNELVGDIAVNNLISYSGNPAIDTTLNYQLSIAKIKNISIDIKANVSRNIIIGGKSQIMYFVQSCNIL